MGEPISKEKLERDFHHHQVLKRASSSDHMYVEEEKLKRSGVRSISTFLESVTRNLGVVLGWRGSSYPIRVKNMKPTKRGCTD
jgi:hypothetical protein